MKSYFAYIRVSTVKQGEHGSSLQEQRDAIESFAIRHGLTIAAWFEERETAAKVGRGEFSQMLAALKKGKASGVIFHKIDRSARNLKDWSTIQDLADQGVDVRFTQESINLSSNEGKLTGDFLAVISSHYIRNLREEVKKGIRGRLKQGLYPLGAPLGYLDQGGGKPKIPDPTRAPFIHDAFELYGSGKFTLHALSDELFRRGLRSKIGKQVGINRLSEVLRNPFYIGIIRMKRSGETYAGIHQPIVLKRMFDRVQIVLDGKMNTKALVHDFLFRKMIACGQCGYHLIGERQKGRVYYRCHTRECSICSIREDMADAAIRERFVAIRFLDDEIAELHHMTTSFASEWANKREGYAHAVNLQIENHNGRMSRLMDAYLDGAIERPLFDEKKLALLMERRTLEEQRDRITSEEQTITREVSEFLELVESLPSSYEIGNPEEKRKIVKTVTSNFCAVRKNVVVELRSPFREVAKLAFVPTGAPVRYRPRTFARKVFNLLIRHFTVQTEERQRQGGMLPDAA